MHAFASVPKLLILAIAALLAQSMIVAATPVGDGHNREFLFLFTLMSKGGAVIRSKLWVLQRIKRGIQMDNGL